MGYAGLALSSAFLLKFFFVSNYLFLNVNVENTA